LWPKHTYYSDFPTEDRCAGHGRSRRAIRLLLLGIKCGKFKGPMSPDETNDICHSFEVPQAVVPGAFSHGTTSCISLVWTWRQMVCAPWGECTMFLRLSQTDIFSNISEERGVKNSPRLQHVAIEALTAKADRLPHLLRVTRETHARQMERLPRPPPNYGCPNEAISCGLEVWL